MSGLDSGLEEISNYSACQDCISLMCGPEFGGVSFD